MKLSDKLAALEAEERSRIKTQEPPPDQAPKSRSAARRTEKVPSKWSDAKRKVRELVLADIGSKLSGPKALTGAALEKEVRSALDKMLRREEVKISPIERQRFVGDAVEDRLEVAAVSRR